MSEVPHPPKPGGISMHIDFVDWTRADNRISVGFTIFGPDKDALFDVRLVIVGDAEEDAAVNQLGELAGGPSWHRVRRVIGPQARAGSRLNRDTLYNVKPNAQYIVEMDPRGFSGDEHITIAPTIYVTDRTR